MSELLEMLKEENRQIHDFELRNPSNLKSVEDEFGDGYYNEYYQHLLQLVEGFADLQDSDVLRLIAYSIYDPRSAVARKIAEQKDKALPVVDELVRQSLPDDREHAAGILMYMLKDPSLSCGTRKTVIDRLFGMLGDQDTGVLFEVINALGVLGNSQAVAALQQLAQSDPHSYRYMGKGRLRYPVREAAQRRLDDIQSLVA
ncbi:MAG TPA: HEAT repeat domain-containing protein [Candidatus Acidoferrum sp.]